MLGMVPLVCPCVDFKRRIVVPDSYDLLEINGKKDCDGTGLFVLMNVPKLMG